MTQGGPVSSTLQAIEDSLHSAYEPLQVPLAMDDHLLGSPSNSSLPAKSIH